MHPIVQKLNQIAGSDLVVALKNGTQRVIPYTILGSVFMLIRYFPVAGFTDTLAAVFGENWVYSFDQLINATFNILSVIIVVSIAYEYAKIKAVEPLHCAFIALVCFLASSPQSVTSGNGDVVNGVFLTSWLGGSGSITAIILGMFMSWLYCRIAQKNITVKVPESVPAGVVNAFTSLVPGFCCMLVTFVISAILKWLANVNLTEGIFRVLQIPMQLALGTLWGAVFASVMTSLFWMIGVHSSVVGGVIDPIFRANSLANQQLIASGTALTVANGAYLMTYPIERHFMQMSGSGLTIGLVLAMLFAAKSARYKTLGKLALVPSIFNVNEPIIFGFPIVFNFKMLIPFVVVPALGTIIGYVATEIGFIPIQGSFEAPWTCPLLFSGFLQWGWQGIVVQLIITAVSFLGYYPFFRKFDNEAYAEEQSFGENQEA